MNFKVDDMVITEFKNRWGLSCAGTIIELRDDDAAIVEVWNINGPGANQKIIIPLDKLKKAENVS